LYWKGKEDGIEQAFVDIGFDLVEDMSRRKKHKADKVMYNSTCDITIAIDHKSTTNKEGIRITKDMLDKVKLEAGKDAIGVITFTLYDMQRKFVIIEIDDFGLLTR
jgi:hypothetical protein